MNTPAFTGSTRRHPGCAPRACAKFLAGVALAFGMASDFGHARADAVRHQSHDEIRAAARDFAARAAARGSVRAEVEVGAIDPRLRLAACPMPVEAFWPSGAQPTGNTTVGVRCPSGSPWTLYVPVRVRTWHRVLVTARPVPRSAILTPADLRTEPREVADLDRGYLSRPEEAVGKHASRALASGTVLTPSMLTLPPLVRRGDRVTVLAGSGPLEVRLTAEALADGRAGETVRVRNPLTRKVIYGIVSAAGTVRVAH